VGQRDTIIEGNRGDQIGQPGADRFGMSNLEYDIVTTLSNLSQGFEALERYAADADQAGDGETATIFRTMQENNRTTIRQLRNALARHVSSVSPTP
jgi:hypothetical protein